MNKKGLTWVVWAVVLALFVSACAGAPGSTGKGSAEELPPEIVLPIMGPFTGPYPAAGEDFKQGAEMAVDEINAAGGIRGSMLKLEYFDTKLDPTEAANLARTIVADERFPLLIGPWSSSSTFAALPILEEAGMVLWTPSASSAEIAQSKWGFKMSPNNHVIGALMAELAVQEVGLKKLASIYVQNDFAINQKRLQGEVAKELGGEIVIEEGFTPDTTDFRPILSKIKESGAEGLLLNCYSPEGALIINQANELGLEIAMIGDGIFIDDAFFSVVGDNAEGLYAVLGEGTVARISNPSQLPAKAQAFAKNFQERYGESAQAWEDATYDVIFVVAEVIDRVGLDRAAIRDELEAIEGIETVREESFTMGERHWPVSDLLYYRWENGAYQLLKDAPQEKYLSR